MSLLLGGWVVAVFGLLTEAAGGVVIFWVLVSWFDLSCVVSFSRLTNFLIQFSLMSKPFAERYARMVGMLVPFAISCLIWLSYSQSGDFLCFAACVFKNSLTSIAIGFLSKVF